MKNKMLQDINIENSKYWHNRKDDVQLYGQKHPDALNEIANHAEKLIKKGLINDVAFISHTSLDAAVKLEQHNTHINIASNGGHAKHKESKLLKLKIIERYKADRDSFKSKDEAAEVYTKEWPLEFSTIRKYLKNL